MAKKGDQWMPLYIGDYLADTGRLTTEGHGAYLLLLMDYWRNGAPPDDDSVLAGIVRLPIAKWKRLRAVVQPFFTVAAGRWNHKRVDEELARTAQIIEQRVSAGKAGAKAKWAKTDDGTNGKRMASAMPPPMANGWQTDGPLPIPSPEEAADDPRAFLSKARDTVLDALGVRNDPRWFGDAGRVEAWLNQGADLERDILPTIRRLMAKRNNDPPRSLKYFDQAISDSVATRNHPLPEGKSHASSQESRNGFVAVALDRARGTG